jgi:hypothetical protein
MAVARFSPTELDVTVHENRFLVTGKAHKAKGGSLTAKRAAAGAGFPDAVRGAESGTPFQGIGFGRARLRQLCSYGTL